MAGEDDRQGDPRREGYVRRTILAETEPDPGAVPFLDLYRFVTGQGQLSMAQQRSLFTNPIARANYQALKRDRMVFEIPMRAAAATDVDVVAEQFEGWEYRIVKSSDGSTVLRLSFDLGVERPARVLIETDRDGLQVEELRYVTDDDAIVVADPATAEKLWDPGVRISLLR